MKSRIINFFTGQPNNFVTIILALLSIAISIWISSQNINNLRFQVNKEIQNISNQLQKQSQTQNLNFVPGTQNILGTTGANDQNNKSGFNSTDWIFYEETLGNGEFNKEGYFCPQNNAFPILVYMDKK